LCGFLWAYPCKFILYPIYYIRFLYVVTFLALRPGSLCTDRGFVLTRYGDPSKIIVPFFFALICLYCVMKSKEGAMIMDSLLPPYTLHERSRELLMSRRALCWRARRALNQSRRLQGQTAQLLHSCHDSSAFLTWNVNALGFELGRKSNDGTDRRQYGGSEVQQG
jgi:hypothetical protein